MGKIKKKAIFLKKVCQGGFTPPTTGPITRPPNDELVTSLGFLTDCCCVLLHCEYEQEGMRGRRFLIVVKLLQLYRSNCLCIFVTIAFYVIWLRSDGMNVLVIKFVQKDLLLFDLLWFGFIQA